VMFIGGLWHGAAWTFVVWGLIHGIFLVIERIAKGVVGDARWTETFAVKLMLGIITYTVVAIAWVFFRAADFPSAARLLAAMAGVIPVEGDTLLTTREILQVALITLGLLMAHWSMRDTSLEAVVTRMPRGLVLSVWTLMLCAIILTQGNGNAFIYFQF